ncbi:MAG: PadR family transcriptional regulator, partial [Acidimicrobiaceae bacterium]|nr:PadR family transcriptional regulator [Acidimicrobiaceae bacterium]
MPARRARGWGQGGDWFGEEEGPGGGPFPPPPPHGGPHWIYREVHRKGGPPHRTRQIRLRRGDIRQVVLSALLDGPAHGYEIIRRLEERSGGLWRPSAGSVYPMLQQLEDEELVTSDAESQSGGKRVYQLTDAGREEASQATDLPWGRPGVTGPAVEIRASVGAIQSAARQ